LSCHTCKTFSSPVQWLPETIKLPNLQEYWLS